MTLSSIFTCRKIVPLFKSTSTIKKLCYFFLALYSKWGLCSIRNKCCKVFYSTRNSCRKEKVMKSNQNFICATSKLFPLEAAKERETIIGLPTRCPMMMTTRAKVSLIFGTHCARARPLTSLMRVFTVYCSSLVWCGFRRFNPFGWLLPFVVMHMTSLSCADWAVLFRCKRIPQ